MSLGTRALADHHSSRSGRRWALRSQRMHRQSGCSLHNMVAVAVGFGRLLYIGDEVETEALAEQEDRMRYISGKDARDKYAAHMIKALSVSRVDACRRGNIGRRGSPRRQEGVRFEHVPVRRGGVWRHAAQLAVTTTASPGGGR